MNAKMCEFAPLASDKNPGTMNKRTSHLPAHDPGGEEVGAPMFIKADEIAKDLDISVPYAYKIIRKLNSELEESGFMVIPGRVSRHYYEEKFYGISKMVRGR